MREMAFSRTAERRKVGACSWLVDFFNSPEERAFDATGGNELPLSLIAPDPSKGE